MPVHADEGGDAPDLHIVELDRHALPSHAELVRAGLRASAKAQRLGEGRFAASPEEVRQLERLGVFVRVVEWDASDYYARRLLRQVRPSKSAVSIRRPSQLKGRSLNGSMGGYLTLTEVEQQLRALASEHPSFIHLTSIGTSVEKRPIHALCLSANAARDCAAPSSPDGDHTERLASTLFTALTHSREPITLSALLDFVLNLVHAHTMGGQEGRQLLSRRRLWFVPVVNPDGYAYNYRVRPYGGGTKRKNGRDDGQCRSKANAGVDINRNFGFQFGANNDGSSPRPCAEDYRGPKAFSEPESSALAELIQRERVDLVINMHGWGNSITHPFGYSSADSIHGKTPLERTRLLLYRQWAAEMTAFNGFVYGRAWETVGYEANGLPDDWAQGSLRVPSLTVELGSARDGFWPQRNRIEPISAQFAYPAEYAARASGAFLRPGLLQLHSPRTIASNTSASMRTAAVRVRFTVSNAGLRTTGPGSYVRLRAVAHGLSIAPVRPVRRQAPKSGFLTAAWLQDSPADPPRSLRMMLPPISPGRTWQCSEVELVLRVPAAPMAEGPRGEGANRSETRRRAMEPKLMEVELVEGARADGAEGTYLSEVQGIHVELDPDGAPSACTNPERCFCARKARRWVHGPACDHGPAARLSCHHPAPRVLPYTMPTHRNDTFAATVTVPGPNTYLLWTPSAFPGKHQCSLVGSSASAILVVYQTCSRWGPIDVVGFGSADRRRTAKADFPCDGSKTYIIFSNGENGGRAYRLRYVEHCADGSAACTAAGPATPGASPLDDGEVGMTVGPGPRPWQPMALPHSGPGLGEPVPYAPQPVAGLARHQPPAPHAPIATILGRALPVTLNVWLIGPTVFLLCIVAVVVTVACCTASSVRERSSGESRGLRWIRRRPFARMRSGVKWHRHPPPQGDTWPPPAPLTTIEEGHEHWSSASEADRSSEAGLSEDGTAHGAQFDHSAVAYDHHERGGASLPGGPYGVARGDSNRTV